MNNEEGGDAGGKFENKNSPRSGGCKLIFKTIESDYFLSTLAIVAPISAGLETT